MVNNHYIRLHQDCRTDKDADFWFKGLQCFRKRTTWEEVSLNQSSRLERFLD